MMDYIIEKMFSAKADSSPFKKDSNSIVATKLHRYKLLVVIYDIKEIQPVPKNYP